jgi:beta-N-acetylhexosaminidase
MLNQMTASSVARVDSLLAQMPVTQKAGQTLMIGFEGLTLTPELRNLIEHYHIGGVILFERNVASPDQVAQLTTDLQRVARMSGNLPLLIAIDQEGGRVARLTEQAGFVEFPSAMAVAATGDLRNARRVAQALAIELRAVGINVDFAPVLDVNNNPANPVIGTRSFGCDPRHVAALGVAFIEAMQAEGVLAFGKHFPGHGDTGVDPHFALPTIIHDLEHLEAIESVPFYAAFATQVAGIVSAHVIFPALDPTPGRPATLSPAVLTGLLRDRIGYDGLLVTDSLEMGALVEAGYTPPRAALAAFMAGADVLLFNKGHDDHRLAFDLILDQVRYSERASKRLDTAVRRILLAKARLGLFDSVPHAVPALVGTADRRFLASMIAAAAITLLRDDACLLPLSGDLRPYVLEIPGITGLGHLMDAIAVPIHTHPTDDDLRVAMELAEKRQPLVVGVAGLSDNPEQAKLVNALLASGASVVLVALRDPYDLLAFPNASTMLATYGVPPPTFAALAEVLTGKVRPQGRLPVELPGLFALGDGLQELPSQRKGVR